MNLFNENRSQGPVTNATRSFFTRKTIQRSYNFLVRFDLSNSLQGTNLSEFHAVSVELPNYEFKKESYQIGSFVKSFPVLDHNGFEFTMKFEEDDVGTISNLIDNLTRLIIKPNGYYNTISRSVIDNIIVSVHRSDGVNVCTYVFNNCFFMKASTPTYSYDNNEKIVYDITFNADHFIKYYGKAHLVPNYDSPEQEGIDTRPPEYPE
jgi:hypothetical protein